MKNPFKKSNTELDINGVGKILTSGAAAGIAIAAFVGKNGKTAGMIGAGLSLLVTGLLVAMDEDNSKHNYNNN
jgi:hypothetical protein